MVAINITALVGVVVSTFILQSVLWIALFSLFSTIISLICFFIATRVNIDYTFREQISDIGLTLVLSLIMGTCVYVIGLVEFDKIVLLLIQILVGGIIYIVLSACTKNSSYVYIRDFIIRGLFKRKYE